MSGEGEKLSSARILARKIAVTFGMKPTMHDTRDSSVGRAGDCSWLRTVISRPAVRLRLAGCALFCERLLLGRELQRSKSP